MKLPCGIIVLAVGFFFVRWIMKCLTHNDHCTKPEPTVKGFLLNLFKIILYIIVALTAAHVMGIPHTSFFTLPGSAGAAISLAMQGSLSNLVGGFTILLPKPFKVDDYVRIGETGL